MSPSVAAQLRLEQPATRDPAQAFALLVLLVWLRLELHSLALSDCLAALRMVHETVVNDGLVLRALAYFDDAQAELALPGEGRDDWDNVKAYFSTAVAALIVPPRKTLVIQRRRVGVRQKRTLRATPSGTTR